MALHSRKLSFTIPILVSFTGILLSFLLIAVSVTLTQSKDLLRSYHDINRKFTHNLALNYTDAIFHESEYVLGKAATLFSRNNQLKAAVSDDPGKGLQMLMQLQTLMPDVSSISLADTEGHYLRAPEALENEESDSFDARTRPWFVKQAESSSYSRYTQPYMDYFIHNPTVAVYRPVISPEGRLKGTLAFHLNLTTLASSLRQMSPPVQGEFYLVDRDGKIVLHPDMGMFSKQYVNKVLMEKMTSGEGQLYDQKKNNWYYYYSFTNPDWFVIYRVSGATLSDLTQHETAIITWGFTLASIILILFGLYLRHAARTVLMNIINAIQTGEVKQSPRLEAILSKAIKSNREREQAYARQATIDALTGCLNRRAFDSHISERVNAQHPFTMALIDIDNFKSINDTWGHLTGDIVLRNIAREGLKHLKAHNLSVYRYGGEEFAVIFPEGDEETCLALLETWRMLVEQRNWREEGLKVTFSGGMGEWRLEPIEEFIGTVDDALYKAKQQGKNRIILTSSQ